MTAPALPVELAERVIGHLIDLNCGTFALTPEALLDEPDPVLREILTGMRLVHEDLDLHRQTSERRLAELSRSEALSRTILDATADAIVTVDAQGLIRGWNRAATAIFGHPADDALGLPVATRLPGVMVAAGGATRREVVTCRRDGSPLTVEVRLGELSVAGEALRVAVIRDLTEDKKADAQLRELNHKLVDASRQAGMAEVATGVLHNVGNVLNSVNVSARVLDEELRGSELRSLAMLADLVDAQSGDLARFVTADPRGARLPQFLRALSKAMHAGQDKLLAELALLRQNVEHINTIVAMQQNHVRSATLEDMGNIAEVVDEAITMERAAFDGHHVALVRDYEATPRFLISRHKMLQILVNLLRNARHAVQEARRDDGCVRVAVRNLGATVRVEVADNGVGVRPDHFPHLFEQGFTTKPQGHGYGLHASALAMKELGGRIDVHSDGAGRGATFVLELPVRVRGG